MQNLIVVVCLAIGLLLGLSIQAQTENWQQTDIGEGITLKYPGASSKKELAGGLTLYRYKTTDSLSVLTALVRDLTSLGITEDQLNDAVQTEEFWVQVQSSALQSLTGSTLLQSNKIKVKDLPAISLEIEWPRDGKKNIHTQLIFVRGLRSYTINFNSLDGKGDTAIKELYFKSLEF